MLGARRPNSLIVLAALALACALPWPSALAQNEAYSASEVKAAFLYHFGTYVEWPPVNAPRSGDPITIAVLGDPDIAEQLGRFLPGRRIAGRPVEVRQLGAVADLADDEVLFIGSQYNPELMELIAMIGQRPVLVVSDAPDGLSSGAMVNFTVVDERVRFEISLARAEESGLMLSSRLLSAALRVETSFCCGLESLPRSLMPLHVARHRRLRASLRV